MSSTTRSRFIETADRLQIRLLALQKKDACLRLEAVKSSLLLQPELGFRLVRRAERASARAIDDQYAALDALAPAPRREIPPDLETEWAATYKSTVARAHASRGPVEFGLTAIVRCLQASGDLLAQVVNASVFATPLHESECDIRSIARPLVAYPTIAASLARFSGSDEYRYADDASNMSKHRSLLRHATSIHASVDAPTETTSTLAPFTFCPRNGRCPRSHLPCSAGALEARWVRLISLGEDAVRQLISHLGSDLTAELPE
jgi:hypothetical protein